MKEVIFKKLIGKNFLSIGNIPLEFPFPKGINIITGYNFDKNDENGVGKTTIVQLFFWVLFGESLSSLKKDEVVNDINKKNCFGSLEFDIIKNGKTNTYIIERGIKPSYCKVFINGDENKTLSTIPATNDFIQALISSTPNVFRNCIVLSMNNTVPFMQQGKSDRKAFVESMFKLEALRHMDKMAREKYNDLSRQQEINLETKNNLDQNKKTFAEKKVLFEEQKKNKKNELISRKNNYLSEIDTLKKQITIVDTATFNNIKEQINEQTKQHQELTEQSNTIRSEILLLERQKERDNAELQKIQAEIHRLKTDIKEKIKEPLVEKTLSLEEKESKIKEMIENLPKEIKTLSETSYSLKYENQEAIKTINKIKSFGAVCITCQRPFSDEEQAESKKQIAELEGKISENEKKISHNLSLEEKINDKVLNAKLLLSFIDLSKKVMAINSETSNVEAQYKNKTKELNPVNEKIKELLTDISRLNEKNKEFEKQVDANSSIERQINNLERFIKEIENDIQKIDIEKNVFDDMLIEAEAKLDKITSIVNDTKTQIQIYDNIKFIVSEDGIKSYIIKKLISILNERISYYLSAFESNAKLTFDEYFVDNLYNDKGIEKSYENFSGGERKRIDLACLFAFLDIRRIQGDVRFNVVFFDELLDSAISSKACNLVFNILKERMDLYNENSYVITHRKEFKTESKDLINNIVNLEKRNGFTKIGNITKQK